MKRLRELETEWVRITLLEEEGVGFYVREVGLTDKNEHDTLQRFQKESEANAEVNRLAELLQNNGSKIIKDTYYFGKKEPVEIHDMGEMYGNYTGAAEYFK